MRAEKSSLIQTSFFSGIWPEGAQGNEINSVDVSPDQNVIALGEDSHLVKLYNYPCYVPKVNIKKYSFTNSYLLKNNRLQGQNSCLRFSTLSQYEYS